ncbi:MAG TPA: hypothetical protein VN829_19010, partial [Dongiaceae bacterium]|nr:hypothetical protein [Dongiaceae bacterium]
GPEPSDESLGYYRDVPPGQGTSVSSRRDAARIAQRFNAGNNGHNRPIQAPPGAAETLEV